MKYGNIVESNTNITIYNINKLLVTYLLANYDSKWDEVERMSLLDSQPCEIRQIHYNDV